MSLSKSSDLDRRHQKQPDFMQHFLKRLPDPHGQRSLRPSFSLSSLPPCTIRTPRLTPVSEGNPLRRLLIVSKKMAGSRVLACPRSTVLHEKRMGEPAEHDTNSRELVHPSSPPLKQQSGCVVDGPRVDRTLVQGKTLFCRPALD